MATALFAFLALALPFIAFADNLSPVYPDLCNEVECGKGSCVSNSSSPFGFVCQCESGWKRTRLDNEDDLKFLPCVIPNCSVDYSCLPAAPPAPSIPYNTSFFDPCYWIYCGGGTCTKSKAYTHTCQCNSGFTNLMGIDAYPCFSDCAIGSDCSKLGIKLSNSTSTSDNGNHASHLASRKFLWITTFIASLALVWYR
ncbi:hypothetical protein MLD38_016421 [Melastoma candidum]|uniref:Uncharacterized protein n=1 Tax=Melastoma candidum TaxID=119954 RepID=A0ACB9RKJ5_9MYRT|nr:hypothetical protein MLD38_016421 [Melastoma candidum]